MTLYVEQYDAYASQVATWATRKNMSVGGDLAVGGTLSVTGSVALTEGITIGGTLVGDRKSVAASGGTTRILTAANSGSLNLFDSAAGITYTLPAPAVGLQYNFVTSTLQTSSAHVVVTDAGSTLLIGSVVMLSGEDVTPSATLGPKMFAANGSTHIKYTSNGTTTGGGIGTWLQFTCISATRWHVIGVVKSPSGSIATPFST